MNIKLPLLLTIFAGFGTTLGSFIVFIPKFNKERYISLFLSISATIMMSLSILELIPSSVRYIVANHNIVLSLLLILIPFIIGIITINLIDKLYRNEDNIYKIGILSLISLAIHNFPEGIATFLSSIINIKLGITLTIAILLHNIPEGICIALPIYNSSKSKFKALFFAFIASLSEPVGGLLGFIILKNIINNLTISVMLLFASGIMITLSINKIYKESYLNKKYLILGIIIGFIITLINLIIENVL